ncbi:MAG: M48 family metallopeptidase [Clostridia bacterium]|nr:M48 family metallopeptidase [Clostridia bacterium]
MIKYEYSLIRSARRTVSLSIKDDNSLVVHAPLRLPISEIEKFILSKSGWIDRHLHQNEVQNAAFSDVYSYKSILVAGVPVKFEIGERNSFLEDWVCVKSLKSLKKLYVDNLGGQFMQLFEEICREHNFKCGKVGFKDYKSRWGCCDRAGNITFNYKLLMLPQQFWRYVAAHELCHTVYMDHSKMFYCLLERILPDYKTYRKQLKMYPCINRLY